MDRDTFGDYLRTRRARIQPRHVGLPTTGNRRTPGLRRQEVAQLANMSIDYYIRLEQARGPKPSRQVLNALSRALMLNQDERAHLFHLAGDTPEPSSRIATDIPVGVLHMLDSLVDTPAYVVDAKYDLLKANPLARALMGQGEMAQLCGSPNMMRGMFADPDAAQHLRDPDKARFAQSAVADLRASAARYPDDPELRQLVEDLLRVSPEFGELWQRHEVEVRRHLVKRIKHPKVGLLELECQTLLVPDRDQRVIMYLAAPGSVAQQRLRALRETVPG
ncbi:helix-turn-helix protein [Stackebrandtia endophytica]|uniref:Helix-turn-helix protein n=1 Tax=Stackebrandtia endophytica TaxID=1496996 RepID=A0A543AYP9_9ACTN|nr:helix-turn-helix transcriptional regulator [Stackebrandtia endophytica]TQL77650.1 helix-turn-helix protein [Stackebrandtia endophytica]